MGGGGSLVGFASLAGSNPILRLRWRSNAALWAADRPAPLSNTLIYTLFLCNFVVIAQDRLGFVYRHRRPLRLWLVYSPFLLAVALAGVLIVNFIEYPAWHAPGQSLWQFEESGWKFPFIATLIFGVSFQLYRTARERLEGKNRELPASVMPSVNSSRRSPGLSRTNESSYFQSGNTPTTAPAFCSSSTAPFARIRIGSGWPAFV